MMRNKCGVTIAGKCSTNKVMKGWTVGGKPLECIS